MLSEVVNDGQIYLKRSENSFGMVTCAELVPLSRSEILRMHSTQEFSSTGRGVRLHRVIDWDACRCSERQMIVR